MSTGFGLLLPITGEIIPDLLLIFVPFQFFIRSKFSQNAQGETVYPLISLQSHCSDVLLHLLPGHRIHSKSRSLTRNGICIANARHKDRLFVAILYTSDSDRIMRYTDEVRGNEGFKQRGLIGSVGASYLIFIRRAKRWNCVNGPLI